MPKEIEHITNFNSIVRQYHTMVFRTILGFVHIKEDAEDLTQEVFIKAYKQLDKFRGEANISTWLYRIAVNSSLNFVAAKQRRNTIFLVNIWESLFLKADVGRNPQQELESVEERKIVASAIDSLPEKQRTALVLTRFNDLPQKEVAEIMGISQRAVEQLLLRAKRNLSKKLKHP